MSGRSTLSQLEEGGRNVPRVHLRGPAGNRPSVRSDSRYSMGEEIQGATDSVILHSLDLDLGREVAMTILREDRGGAPESVARFLEEARIAGRLQHPGVLPVYELGLLPDGRPFFTMKLPRGETLAEILEKSHSDRPDARRLLAVFEQLCQTVAYAHSKGVVHGSLSGARVVVGPFGEVCVTDWGQDSAGDRRSDVRALGSILLRVLSGPGEGEPAALDSCAADPELVELCRRCLTDGFEDAGAVAAVFSGFLASVEERAHRSEIRTIEERAAADRSRERAEAEGAKAEAQRRARRQTLALAGAVLVVLLTAGVAWWSIEAGRRERASRAAGVVEAALRDSARRAGEGDLVNAVAAAERACVLASDEAVADSLRARAQSRLADVRSEFHDATVSAEREERQRRLPGVLRGIRVRRGIDPPETTAAAYRKAFREYGISPEPGAAERIRNDPLADALVGALRDWARVPAPFADVETISALALAAGGEDQRPTAVADLREAWWEQPDDFELNLELSERLLLTTPARPGDSIRHLTVATALAPHDAGLWVRLGDACKRAGNEARAVRAYRYAAVLAPDWPVPRQRLE